MRGNLKSRALIEEKSRRSLTFLFFTADFFVSIIVFGFVGVITKSPASSISVGRG